MEQEKVMSIAKAYADSVRRVLPVKDVYLYGSYARGTAGKYSDIDIAVIVDPKINPNVELSSFPC